MDMLPYIHESNLIEDVDDPQEDQQSLIAWDYLKKQDELSHGTIQKVQKIITLNQADLSPHQRGYYRSMSKVNVHIGEHAAPAWWLVDALMDNWLLDIKEYWQTLDPIEMHIRFEYAHPFADGNGRTGRYLLWWHELRLGKIPTLFLNSEKQEKYYPLFQRKRGKIK